MLSHDYVTNETAIGCADHRAGDAGAVLAVVNALRFASTRPAAGPWALTTSTRGTVGSYAMVAGLTMRRMVIDAAHPQA